MPDRNEPVNVVIVYAHNPDTDGPDTDRIGQTEQYPRNIARTMVNSGAARWPDGSTEAPALESMGRAELISQARVRGIHIDRGATRTEVLDVVRNAVAEQAQAAEEQQHDGLESLTIAELREQYPAAADMPANTRKADLIAAIEEAQASDQGDSGEAADVDADGEASGVPVVTVAPGAESNPDPDLTDRTS